MKRTFLHIALVLGLVALTPCLLRAQYLGGTGDGNNSGSVSGCTPAAAPSVSNLSKGGTGDGYYLGNLLSNCIPATAPATSNIALGGGGDGSSSENLLSNCTPATAPTLSNLALGGTGDGNSIGNLLSRCTP